LQPRSRRDLRADPSQQKPGTSDLYAVDSHRPALVANQYGGLLAEEVDPVSGELLGNFPQAFSHIGLVNAAWAISESELQQTPQT
jgi:Glycosyl hydrolases family 15